MIDIISALALFMNDFQKVNWNVKFLKLKIENKEKLKKKKIQLSAYKIFFDTKYWIKLKSKNSIRNFSRNIVKPLIISHEANNSIVK